MVSGEGPSQALTADHHDRRGPLTETACPPDGHRLGKDDPDGALGAHTVEEGSPSGTALRLLATWGRESPPVT
ncbi:hypothetical protein GCM10017687_76420 [Streptomyces echinatus]